MNVYKLLRVLKDETVKELADNLMITPAYIGAIEHGKRKPSTRLKRDYQRHFAISAEDFDELEAGIESEDLCYGRMLLKILR